MSCLAGFHDSFTESFNKSLSEQLRSPEDRTLMGYVSKHALSMGTGNDSIDAVSLLKTKKTGHVIVELGPGLGHSLREILNSKKPSKVYAIEISESFRKDLQNDPEIQSAIESGVLSIHGDDASRLPFIGSDSVDCVFGFDVVYFLYPLRMYLQEMYRILKPGKVIVWGVKDSAKTYDKTIFYNTDWKKIKERMEKAGFVKVKISEERLGGGNDAYFVISGKKPLPKKSRQPRESRDPPEDKAIQNLEVDS